MKTKFAFIVAVLLLVLGMPAPAQNRVIANSQGYQLTEEDLRPALELLVFLAQSNLTEAEIQYIAGEAIQEFQATPAALLESLQDLSRTIRNAEATNDPLVLGEVRQQLIAELYKWQQSSSPEEVPAYIKVLFRKAPVVAYDPQTNVALTQPDLDASVAFLRTLNQYQENQIPPDQMALAGQELVNGFSDLDADTQKLLASGTILNTILDANLKTMSPQQRTNFTSHYRTTTGGPPTRTRGGEEAPTEAARNSPSQGLKNTRSLMDSLKASGGSDDYWKMQTGF